MHSPSSTHNSRAGLIALLTAVAAIAAIEVSLSKLLPGRFFSHELDRIVQRLEISPHKPSVVMVGDSVSFHLFSQLGRRKPNRFAWMSSNRATEMAGHYFLIRRYLDMGRTPHAVIFCARYPFHLNLEQKFTENYVQRCFTRWHEIWDMAWHKKDPVFGLRSVYYKLFASYKYRLHLQKMLLGTTNADIYTGKLGSHLQSGYRKRAGIFRVFYERYRIFRKMDLSRDYFLKTVKMLDEESIEYYYLPAPMPKEEYANSLEKAESEWLRSLEKEWPRFHYREDLLVLLPVERFGDGVHLDERGLELARQIVDPFLWAVSMRTLPELQNK